MLKIGAVPKWRIPKTSGFKTGKDLGGTPISGNLHVMKYDESNGKCCAILESSGMMDYNR